MHLLCKAFSQDSTSENSNVCFKIVVLSGNHSSKPQLPITIALSVPHMILLLGLPGSSFNPGLKCVLDTGSVICVAWAPFMLALAKKYPFLVKSITYCNNEYQPIQLAGIVEVSEKNENSVPVGCELKAVIELHMPYKTTTGVGSTSIKFAIGNQVSVNCLIGMSFIQMAKLHIDLEDNVVESSVLQMDPIKLSFQRPQKHLLANIPTN